MGVMLSAAGSLDWFRHAITPDLTGDDAFARIDAMAAEVPVGADGVLFLPYLSGERTPHPDANARGTFVGLDLRHDRRHLARAVIEGVTHGLRECLDLVRSTGLVTRESRLSGGGVKSDLWRQLCADLLGIPVATTTTIEGTVYGAAILAAVGAGSHASVPAACDAWVRETGRLDPGPDASVLDARHAVYTRLYPALREVFPAIAAEVTS
jgi:xylulokinase